MSRDNLTEEAALPRIRSQLPISDKIHVADKVIDNSGSLQDLKEQVENLLVKLRSKVKWTWLPSWICPPFGLLLGIWTLISRNHLRRDKKRTQ